MTIDEAADAADARADFWCAPLECVYRATALALIPAIVILAIIGVSAWVILASVIVLCLFTIGASGISMHLWLRAMDLRARAFTESVAAVMAAAEN